MNCDTPANGWLIGWLSVGWLDMDIKIFFDVLTKVFDK